MKPYPVYRCRPALAALLAAVMLSACDSGGLPSGEAPELGAATAAPIGSGEGGVDALVDSTGDNPFEVPEPVASPSTDTPTPATTPTTESSSTGIETTDGTQEPDEIVYCD